MTGVRYRSAEILRHLHAIDALIRGVWNDRKIILVRARNSRRRPARKDTHDFELVRADTDRLADRIDASVLKEQLIRGVAEHRHLAAVLDFGPAEEPTCSDGNVVCPRRIVLPCRKSSIALVFWSRYEMRRVNDRARTRTDDRGRPVRDVDASSNASASAIVSVGRLISSENSRPLAKLVIPNR